MFEGRLVQSSILKKLIEAIKDLLTEASWECSKTGINLQAMDNSHVSLVSVDLHESGFDRFRCDRPISLGMNISALSKILRCATNEDTVTIKAKEDNDAVIFIFESIKAERESNYELKLMNLDHEHLSIPETDYAVVVKMPSVEFQRIIRDLSQFGDTVKIACSKNGVKFSAAGDIGVGNIKISQSASVDKEEEAITIDLQEAITLTFACRYLSMFAKACSLSPQVSLSLSPNTPLTVEYKIGDLGHIRYFLAPKIEEDD